MNGAIQLLRDALATLDADHSALYQSMKAVNAQGVEPQDKTLDGMERAKKQMEKKMEEYDKAIGVLMSTKEIELLSALREAGHLKEAEKE